MRTWFLISGLLFSVSGNAAVAGTAPTKVGPGWVNDGARTCLFHEDIRRRTCTQYHQTIEHQINGRKPWSEFRYMWKASSLEVRYASRIGVLGVGPWTIGELFDSRSTLPGHSSHQAVSYSPSRDELVIGVPGEGYEFSVKGGL